MSQHDSSNIDMAGGNRNWWIDIAVTDIGVWKQFDLSFRIFWEESSWFTSVFGRFHWGSLAVGWDSRKGSRKNFSFFSEARSALSHSAVMAVDLFESNLWVANLAVIVVLETWQHGSGILLPSRRRGTWSCWAGRPLTGWRCWVFSFGLQPAGPNRPQCSLWF